MTVLLADEPAGAVDTATGEEIGELLLDLNAAGQTLVLVTHSPDLAARYAGRTVRLVDGRVAADTGAAVGGLALLALAGLLIAVIGTLGRGSRSHPTSMTNGCPQSAR
jgi:putative ABC transport system ATP-binding protein